MTCTYCYISSTRIATPLKTIPHYLCCHIYVTRSVKSKHVVYIKHSKKCNCNSFCQDYNTITLHCTQELHFVVQDCSMTIILSDIITIILYCIVLYSEKRDWPSCKVVFRVGNQN